MTVSDLAVRSRDGAIFGRLEKPPVYPEAWRPENLRDEDWHILIPDQAMAELREALDSVRGIEFGKAENLSVANFDLEHTREFVSLVKHKIDDGTGFVRLRGIPVDQCKNVEEGKALYWLIGQLVDQPVPQYFDGHMIYDLRYLGVKEQDNEQANRERTNEIPLHSDESLPDVGPKYLSLFCWRQARVGGETRLSSFFEAYRQLAMTRPDLVERLYQPYFWLPERRTPDNAIYYHPVATSVNGRLRVQFSQDYNWRGYAKFNEPYDDLGKEAVAEMQRILEECSFQFLLQPGDIAIFNNDRVAHGRTYHEDWEEPEKKRHLLRLWLGQSGHEYPIPEDYRQELLSRLAR